MPGKKRAYVNQTVVTFELQEADSLEETFTRRLAPVKIEPVPPAGQVGSRGLYASLAGLEFSRTEFLGGFRLTPLRRTDAMFFCFPTAGTLTFHTGRESVRGSATTALAAEWLTCDALDVSTGHAHLALVINRPVLIERLSVLLGHAVVRKPVFEPALDVPSSRIGALRSLISFVTTPEFGLELNHAPRTADCLRGTLIDMVLETWPNSYSEALRQPPPMIAPRYVKLAVDFIHDHPHVLASGEELAALTGVSLRSLQAGFRRFVGSPISVYQRQRRLELARDDLLRDAGASVEDIALRWGFTNTGRFSRYFRSAFGVSPAELAKRTD